jgi:hypothetical protein
VTGSSFGCTGGTFRFPLDSGRVGWLYRDSNAAIKAREGTRLETGIDFLPASGIGATTTVFAPATGVVRDVNARTNSLRIETAPRTRRNVDLYISHLNQMQVGVGQKVTAGTTPIATIPTSTGSIHVSIGLKGAASHNDAHIHATQDPSRLFAANFEARNSRYGHGEHFAWSFSKWCHVTVRCKGTATFVKQPVLCHASATGGSPPYRFEWRASGRTPAAKGQSFSATYTRPGHYTVQAIETDYNGLSTHAAVSVAVENQTETFLQIVAGNGFACGLRAAADQNPGTAVCWGGYPYDVFSNHRTWALSWTPRPTPSPRS